VHGDPTDPAGDRRGDWWDHVAFNAEHRLVLGVVPGARGAEVAEAEKANLHRRKGLMICFTVHSYNFC
jgi:hypothetical protein